MKELVAILFLRQQLHIISHGSLLQRRLELLGIHLYLQIRIREQSKYTRKKELYGTMPME
jgi:hypothetical protein